MREMKDSGIEWIGEIPQSKQVLRNKYMFLYEKGKLPFSTNLDKQGFPYIGASDLDSDKDEYQTYTEDETLPEAQYNDLLVLWDGARAGLCGTHKTGKISSTIVRIRANEFVYQPFLYWYYKGFEKYMYQCVNGTTIPHMNRKYIEQIGFINWSIYEQHRIADYLDDKCGKIDRYIEQQKQVIEKLKAYKQSVITEAVTKGLDPTVPMKDSGVEWIGEIPEGWTIVKLGHIFSYLGGFAYNSNLYTDESDYQVVRIGNVKNYRLVLESNPVYISESTAKETSRYKLQSNTILFTMTGTKGKRDYFFTYLLTDNDVANKNLFLNQRVGCLIPTDDICPKYFDYLLKDNRILDSVFLYETGTANQGNLGIDSIKRTILQFPPVSEQRQIADFLDSKCSSIDAAIAEKQNLIEKLTEYKKSLIYEVVTGKKEV